LAPPLSPLTPPHPPHTRSRSSKRLERLLLHNNRIVRFRPTSVLGDLRLLRVLRLDNNRLTSQAFLPETPPAAGGGGGGGGVFDRLVSLAELDLSGNLLEHTKFLSPSGSSGGGKVGGSAAGTSSSSAGPLRQLAVLRLNGNRLRGEAGPELGALPALQDLSLADNALTGLGGLVGASSLATLDVSGNQLGDAALAALPPLPLLAELNWSRNALTALPASPAALAAAVPVLEMIDLSANAIGPAVPLGSDFEVGAGIGAMAAATRAAPGPATSSPSKRGGWAVSAAASSSSSSSTAVSPEHPLVPSLLRRLSGLTSLAELSVAGNPCAGHSLPAVVLAAARALLPTLDTIDGVEIGENPATLDPASSVAPGPAAPASTSPVRPGTSGGMRRPASAGPSKDADGALVGPGGIRLLPGVTPNLMLGGGGGGGVGARPGTATGSLRRPGSAGPAPGTAARAGASAPSSAPSSALLLAEAAALASAAAAGLPRPMTSGGSGSRGGAGGTLRPMLSPDELMNQMALAKEAMRRARADMSSRVSSLKATAAGGERAVDVASVTAAPAGAGAAAAAAAVAASAAEGAVSAPPRSLRQALEFSRRADVGEEGGAGAEAAAPLPAAAAARPNRYLAAASTRKQMLESAGMPGAGAATTSGSSPSDRENRG
jgi:Leucine-rich repeat (LRR) protein